MEHLTAALAWKKAGCSVVPVAADGSKTPSVPWKAFQTEHATDDTIRSWFTNTKLGVGIVTGAVSGQLEMLELEGRAVTEGYVARLAQAMADNGLTDVWTKITRGYQELSPSGGLHWLYRVDGAAHGNTKLARRPATNAELAENPAEKIKVLIETRGEGGFTVVAPTGGPVHNTGKSWRTIAGTIGGWPTLSVDERDALHAVCTTLDALPVDQGPTVTFGQDDPHSASQGAVRPGDDYNTRAEWTDILAGWTPIRRMGRGWTWRRPGKDTPGISATTGQAADGVDRLFVFSTATEFEPMRPYSKFAAYTLLEHAGDWAAAAGRLRRQGYGQPAAITPLRHLTVVPTPPAGQPVVDGTSARIIEPAPAPDLEQYGATEDGTALALVELHGRTIRYCPEKGQWLTWDGHRWTWDTAEAVREQARAIARSLPEGEGWRAYKKRALSAAGVTGILRHAQSDGRVVVHLDDLDGRPYELNTPGGIVDLTTGTIRPPDPAGLHTRSTAVAPDFDRASDLFDRFLDDTFADDHEVRGYVQRLLGISAIGAVLEQILPFAFGTGANGKSTLLEAVMTALGRGDTGYAIAAPAEMLMARKHSEHPAELAQLAGARLVVCSELDEGQRFAEARIKQLTGRDSINARFMRRDPFTFTPTHSIWLAGNHKPVARTGGPAFWRRVKLLPFTHVVPEDRRDSQLGEKLADETAAVLAWLIRGAADYRTNGLREPAGVVAATQDYAHEQDTVGRFVDEECHLVPDQPQIKISIPQMRAKYEQWCTTVGETPVDPKRLSQELRDRFGVDSDRSAKQRFYVGITVLASDDDEPDRWADR